MKTQEAIETITINGVEYVKKDSQTPATNAEGLPFVLIRTCSAGVHFGYLKSKESTLAGIEVELVNARRIHYWEGACSLSQIAMEGVKKPESCKIAMPVSSITIIAIEIIPISTGSNIAEAPVWKS